MTKNPRILNSALALLLAFVFIGIGFLIGRNSNLIGDIGKSEDQRWPEMKEIIKSDGKVYSVNYSAELKKEDEFSKKHYSLLKDFDCQKIKLSFEVKTCQEYKDIVIKKIEKPNEIIKSPDGSFFNQYNSRLANFARE